MKKCIYLVIALLGLPAHLFAQAVFTGGHLQALTVCGSVDSLNAQLSVRDTVLGQRLVLLLAAPPAHGSAVIADTFRATGDTTAPSGLYYKADSGYAGADTFKVAVADSTGTDTTEFIVAVHRLPYAGAITIPDRWSPNVLCWNVPQRDTGTLSDSVAGGVWSITDTTLATITTAGFIMQTFHRDGLDTVFYTVTDSGCSAMASFPVILTTCEGVQNAAVPQGGVLITPNPSDGAFSVAISAANTVKVHIQITDVLGRQVYEGTTGTNAATGIDLKTNPGIYILTARTADNTWTERLILR